VLIAATTRWSTLLRPSFTAFGEASSLEGYGGAHTQLPVAFECCRCVVGVVATAIVEKAWPLIRRDQLTLEREVASPTVSCPQWEGRDEPIMDQMSTIVVTLEHQEQ
jgi:hypothetical protein